MLANCLRTTIVLSILLYLSTSVGAQDLQLSLSGPANVNGGSSFSASTVLDNNSVDQEIAGWSFGVCHDVAMLQLDGVTEGAATLVVKNGAAPDFNQITLFADGYTAGVVICFTSCATVSPGTVGAELTVGDYSVLAANPIEPAPPLSTTIAYCSSLGNPPVAPVLTVNATSITPVTSDLALTIPTEPLINPNYTLRLSAPATVQTGNQFTASVQLDNNGADLAGWSFGVCFDTVALAIDSVDIGTETMVVRSGAPAEFIDNKMHPGGATSGVVVCFSGCAALLGGTTDAELTRLNFTALADPGPEGAPIATDLNFCETLGDPPIRNILTVNGNSIMPTIQGQTVLIEGVPPTSFQFSVDPIDTMYFIPSSPVDTAFEARVRITQTGGAAPIETQGFSMGLTHDPAQISTIAVAQGDALLALPSGTGPEFIQTNLHANGWTAAVVYSISSIVTMDFMPSQEVLRVDYSTVAAGFAGVETFQNVPLVWADTLGAPPIPNVVVLSDGSGEFPLQVDGIVPMEPQFSGGFVRGDANGDGEILLTDVVFLLADLFTGGPTTRDICFAANDVNSDGLIHLADPVFLLNFLFTSGAVPSFPYPDCGITTIADCELPGFCSP